MIAFLAAAAAFVLAAVAFVLWPLLRRSTAGGVDRAGMNRAILRDQLAELENDVRAGTLDPERAAQARLELERRALDEADETPRPQNAGRRSLVAPLVVALFIPLSAAALYFMLGNLQGLEAVPHPARNLSSITPEKFEEMTNQLAARMEANPDDPVGWTMLGRAYRALERHAEAAQAFGKAAALRPDDAELLADYAETLATSRGRNLSGEPTKLLDRALKIDPDNPKALALAGSAAFERKDYRAAVRHWERLLKQPDVTGELAEALRAGVEEARALAAGRPVPKAPAAAGSISGTVRLAEPLKSGADPDDTVFVFARAEQGPRMPLAIARVKVRDLPYHFTLDDTMAMAPELKISAFDRVVVGARVSKSGNAAAASGDLEGVAAAVKPGTSGVNLTIDQVVK